MAVDSREKMDRSCRVLGRRVCSLMSVFIASGSGLWASKGVERRIWAGESGLEGPVSGEGEAIDLCDFAKASVEALNATDLDAWVALSVSRKIKGSCPPFSISH